MRTKIFCLMILTTMMCSCKWMAAGSYPFVESYNIPIQESVVIEAITKFKDDNPQFAMPDSIYNGDTKLNLEDGRDKNNSNDFWYNFYFYDKEYSQIIFTWVREAIDINETTFALYAINDGFNLSGDNFKMINNDLKGKENKAAIARFETLILEPIKQRLQPLNTDYYIDTQIGPVKVNTKVKNGYKIIGRYKLYNPHPRDTNSEDIEFVKKNIEQWLKRHYQNSTFSSYLKLLNLGNIRIKLDYVFTILLFERILEGDIYTLTVTDDKQKRITVYIAKALCDSEDYSSTEEKLVYPFFDETWHLSISNPKPYKIGDTW